LQIDSTTFSQSINQTPGFLRDLATTATPSISSSSSTLTACLPRRTLRAFRFGAVAALGSDVAGSDSRVAGDAAREDRRDRVVERETVAEESGMVVERLTRDRAGG